MAVGSNVREATVGRLELVLVAAVPMQLEYALAINLKVKATAEDFEDELTECRRAAEVTMVKSIAAAEEAQLMKEKEYESLEMEVKDKTKKLKKLHKKYKV